MREEVSLGLLVSIALILAPLSIASIGGATAIYAPFSMRSSTFVNGSADANFLISSPSAASRRGQAHS